MSDELTVRPATASDEDEVARLLIEMKEHHRTLDPDAPNFRVSSDRLRTFASESISDPEVVVLVARAGERVLSFAKLRFVPKSWGLSCEVDLLAVDESYRGRGIGSMMMEAAEAQALSAGAEGMRLDVSLVNEGAARFYERLGYRQRAVRYSKDLTE